MPRLVCNATTPQELREEIVALLMHRATQYRDLKHTTPTDSKGARFRLDGIADALDQLAGEVKCMELVNAWPSGLKEEMPDTTTEDFRATHCPDCLELNEDCRCEELAEYDALVLSGNCPACGQLDAGTHLAGCPKRRK